MPSPLPKEVSHRLLACSFQALDRSYGITVPRIVELIVMRTIEQALAVSAERPQPPAALQSHAAASPPTHRLRLWVRSRRILEGLDLETFRSIMPADPAQEPPSDWRIEGELLDHDSLVGWPWMCSPAKVGSLRVVLSSALDVSLRYFCCPQRRVCARHAWLRGG
ncbi:MAG: hypothetical protein CL878_10315 [Dehalococcoidia bacterium]|nr:hypothetical protein [Dehalococcoidia bacterium]